MNTLESPSPLQHDVRMKMLEMSIAQVQNEVKTLREENEGLKRFLFQIVHNQSKISDKVRHWPFVVVNGTDTKAS